MKFVIRSLLLVNLLLQFTSALRMCFNQDQNLMLTVILLAFSVMGIIGLTLNNRFVLIIFAACTMLIFIASITIYVISRTEHDDSQPKVPRYISTENQQYNRSTTMRALQKQRAQESRKNGLNLLTNKLMNRGRILASTDHRRVANRSSGTYIKSLPVSNPNDDYVEESSTANKLRAGGTGSLPVARSSGDGEKVLSKMKMSNMGDLDENDEDEGGDTNQVVNEQWLVYDRLQYQRYTNIISQSIDLILQIILAFWLALLLDDESDTCFGGAASSSGAHSIGHSKVFGSGSSSSSSGPSRRRRSRAPTDNGGFHHNYEGPIYNYNGVRYSIRPDSARRESPTAVTTIYR